MSKLIQEIKMLWTTTPSNEYLIGLSDSMPRHIQQMMAVK
jgi:hypothetical protein